jgi:hypothetical protein
MYVCVCVWCMYVHMCNSYQVLALRWTYSAVVALHISLCLFVPVNVSATKDAAEHSAPTYTTQMAHNHPSWKVCICPEFSGCYHLKIHHLHLIFCSTSLSCTLNLCFSSSYKISCPVWLFFPFVSLVVWWMNLLHLFDSNSPIAERTDN